MKTKRGVKMERKQGKKMNKVGGKVVRKGSAVPTLKKVYSPPVVKGINKKVFGNYPKSIHNGGFPSLSDLMKSIPKGGLLDPSLRK